MFNDDSIHTDDWSPKKQIEVGVRIMKKGILPSVTLTLRQAEAVLEQLNSARPEEAATSLLRRIADANVIFPSMCANNMEAMQLSEELQRYRSPLPQGGE